MFGAIGDSVPDRWGRALMRRMERRLAEREGTAPRIEECIRRFNDSPTPKKFYLRGDVWYYLFYVNGRRTEAALKPRTRSRRSESRLKRGSLRSRENRYSRSEHR